MIKAGEDPRFIARRLIVHASEDVGMADPTALQTAVAAAQAVEFVGLPEAQINLAQAVIHLALAPKSNAGLALFRALSSDSSIAGHLLTRSVLAIPTVREGASYCKQGALNERVCSVPRSSSPYFLGSDMGLVAFRRTRRSWMMRP